MEPGHENESNPSKMHTEFIVDGGDNFHQSKKSGSSSPSSSSFSSSGSSFDEDFFHIDEDEPILSKESGVSLHEVDNEVQLASVDAGKVIPIISSPDSEASGLGSPGPITPPEVSVTSPVTILNNGSVTQSPPVQVMGRTDSPGSYRIPSSVFARSNTATPLEWSVASNESLFSIQCGNNSFSRDNVFLYRSGELGKSGDLVFPLTKSGELIHRTNSGELISIQNNPSTGTAILVSNKNSSGLDGIGVTEAAAETIKEVLRVSTEDRKKEKIPADGARHSSSISRHSDASVTSTQSFAFPIRKKRAWPFCYRFNGSRAFCYCSGPSCCCRNGSWAFCYCSNCCSNCWSCNCCSNPCSNCWSFKCCSNPCSNCWSCNRCSNPCSNPCSNCWSFKCCSNPCSNCWSFKCCSNPCSNCWSCNRCSNPCSNPCSNCWSFKCCSNPCSNCCSCNRCSNPCSNCWSCNRCSNPCSNCWSCNRCSNPCSNCWSCNRCSNACSNCWSCNRCSNPCSNCWSCNSCSNPCSNCWSCNSCSNPCSNCCSCNSCSNACSNCWSCKRCSNGCSNFWSCSCCSNP